MPNRPGIESNETRWLRCRVDKGMFSDELAVTYPTEGTYRKSVFVLRDHVRVEGDRGSVRVLVTSKGGRTFATLPSARRDMVLVAPSDLEL